MHDAILAVYRPPTSHYQRLSTRLRKGHAPKHAAGIADHIWSVRELLEAA